MTVHGITLQMSCTKRQDGSGSRPGNPRSPPNDANPPPDELPSPPEGYDSSNSDITHIDVENRIQGEFLPARDEKLKEQTTQAAILTTEWHNTGSSINSDEPIYYIERELRLPDGESLSDVVDDLETDVCGDAQWWRISSHACHHDESPPRPCSENTVSRVGGSESIPEKARSP